MALSIFREFMYWGLASKYIHPSGPQLGNAKWSELGEVGSFGSLEHFIFAQTSQKTEDDGKVPAASMAFTSLSAIQCPKAKTLAVLNSVIITFLRNICFHTIKDWIPQIKSTHWKRPIVIWRFPKVDIIIREVKKFIDSIDESWIIGGARHFPRWLNSLDTLQYTVVVLCYPVGTILSHSLAWCLYEIYCDSTCRWASSHATQPA